VLCQIDQQKIKRAASPQTYPPAMRMRLHRQPPHLRLHHPLQLLFDLIAVILLCVSSKQKLRSRALTRILLISAASKSIIASARGEKIVRVIASP
jgi:hypothetical protein